MTSSGRTASFLTGGRPWVAADAGQHSRDMAILAVEGEAALAELPAQTGQAALDTNRQGVGPSVGTPPAIGPGLRRRQSGNVEPDRLVRGQGVERPAAGTRRCNAASLRHRPAGYFRAKRPDVVAGPVRELLQMPGEAWRRPGEERAAHSAGVSIAEASTPGAWLSGDRGTVLGVGCGVAQCVQFRSIMSRKRPIMQHYWTYLFERQARRFDAIFIAIKRPR